MTNLESDDDLIANFQCYQSLLKRGNNLHFCWISPLSYVSQDFFIKNSKKNKFDMIYLFDKNVVLSIHSLTLS